MLLAMDHVFCNQCGHRNPQESSFCSACGAVLDNIDDHTVTLAKVDPLQDAPGAADDVIVHIGDLPASASLVVRNGSQAGSALALDAPVTRLGRHPDSEVSLDDMLQKVADLAARGIAFVAPLTQVNPHLRTAFLDGPDGVRIEILERKPA